MAKSLIRKNQLSTDIADLVGQYGSGFFISASQTGTFTATLTGANVVYTTGNQTISGLKNFITRPTVNGSGVLLIGEAAGGGTVLATGKNIVYTTGDQIISGVKTFSNGININGYDLVTTSFESLIGYITGYTDQNVDFQNLIIGMNNPVYGTISLKLNPNLYLSIGEGGFDINYANLARVNAVYSDNTQNYNLNLTASGDINLTTNSNINFNKRPLFNGTGVLLSGESIRGKQGLSDDPYIGGNFGTIQLNGGNASVDNGPANGGDAGSINLNGGSAYDGLPGNAGSIDLHGGTDRGHAGSITLYGFQASRGGSISSKGGNIGCHGGNINLDGGVAAGSINRNISGGDINLSANSGASFSIQYANLPTQSDGSIYNKINDNLYIRKSGAWDKVITNKDNLVYATGNQTISGNKSFTGIVNINSGIFSNRPTVNGIGVLLSGEAASLPTTIVYTTGDQIVSGIKKFSELNFQPENAGYGTARIKSTATDGNTEGIGLFSLNNQIANFNEYEINLYKTTRFSQRPTLNGTGVLLSGEAAQVDLSSTVRITGNQTISGTKTFVTNSLLYSGVNVNFDSNTNVKFSGNVTFSNDRVWETGLVLGTNKYIIPYSGGSFSKVPKIFTNLDVTGSTVFNYNITGRTVNGFGLLFSTTLTENATLMIRATV